MTLGSVAMSVQSSCRRGLNLEWSRYSLARGVDSGCAPSVRWNTRVSLCSPVVADPFHVAPADASC